MKTSNYLAKLPQEATIRHVQPFRDYDLITLDLPAPRQRLCPHCGSIDCVIKDSGSWQTVYHIPSHHRGTAVSFHKRRLYCKTGSPLFSGVSLPFPGVSFNSTSFSQRTSCFPGVTQKLLLFPVYTSFFRSSPYFHGVSNESTRFFSSSTR